MEVYLVIINCIALITLFILLIILIFKIIALQGTISDLEYLVYKPLFPFQLNNNDPLQLNMHYNESGSTSGETRQ